MIYRDLVFDIIMDVSGLDSNDDVEKDIISAYVSQETIESTHAILLKHKNSGLSLLDAAIETRKELNAIINKDGKETATDVVD